MNKQLNFTRTFSINAPVERVWQALIEPEMIKKYLFGTNTIANWKVGGAIRFTGTWEGKEYVDKGTVLQFVPKKTLKYSYWSGFSGLPDEPENYSIITFDLSDKGDSTDLRLSQQGFQSEAARDHSAENWTTVMKTLTGLLEGKQTS